MEELIVNRVAKSGIETVDLGEYFPSKEIIELDIKDWLFMSLILKEKEFRQSLEAHNWQQYENKTVCIICSADAIIPLWAYMLVATKLQPFSDDYIYGSSEEYLIQYYAKVIQNFKAEDFADKRVVIKGCGDYDVPAFAYVEITRKLLPYAKTLMFGEPCSTVPVYKKTK